MKRLIIFGIMFVISIGVVHAATLTFGGYYDYVYNMSGSKVTDSDSWVYALYWDQSEDGPGSYGSSDDQYIFSANDGWNTTYDGIFLDTVQDTDVQDTRSYFVRVYNSSDWSTGNVGSATHYVNLDMIADNDTAPSPGYSYTTNPIREYDTGGAGVANWSGNPEDAIGGSNPDGSDWQVIPEPSTFMLLGLGLATVLARRKLRK